MQRNQDIAGQAPFTGETLLLWAAAALAVAFLGLLVFDLVRRRRWRGRQRRASEAPGAKLRKRFSRMRAFQGELMEMLHERSRRGRGPRRKPPEAPR